jgi:hypothetical protein
MADRPLQGKRVAFVEGRHDDRAASGAGRSSNGAT